MKVLISVANSPVSVNNESLSAKKANSDNSVPYKSVKGTAKFVAENYSGIMEFMVLKAYAVNGMTNRAKLFKDLEAQGWKKSEKTNKSYMYEGPGKKAKSVSTTTYTYTSPDGKVMISGYYGQKYITVSPPMSLKW